MEVEATRAPGLRGGTYQSGPVPVLDVTTQDKNELTPLHWVSGGGHIELTRFLVERRRRNGPGQR